MQDMRAAEAVSRMGMTRAMAWAAGAVARYGETFARYRDKQATVEEVAREAGRLRVAAAIIAHVTGAVRGADHAAGEEAAWEEIA